MLLAGEQQAAVTVAVEGLMDAKPSPELDSFLTFDPKACPDCMHAVAWRSLCTRNLLSVRIVKGVIPH